MLDVFLKIDTDEFKINDKADFEILVNIHIFDDKIIEYNENEHVRII